MTEQGSGFRKFQRFVRDSARSAKKKIDDSELSGQISEKATAAARAVKDSYTKEWTWRRSETFNRRGSETIGLYPGKRPAM